jgi:hypothetical protein
VPGFGDALDQIRNPLSMVDYPATVIGFVKMLLADDLGSPRKWRVPGSPLSMVVM